MRDFQAPTVFATRVLRLCVLGHYFVNSLYSHTLTVKSSSKNQLSTRSFYIDDLVVSDDVNIPGSSPKS